jgi:hypothetical protein
MKRPGIFLSLFFAAQLLIAPKTVAMEKPVNEARHLIDFSNAERNDWYMVNDGVMGGISRSEFALTENGTGLFAGRLSLEFNGGFASMRTVLRDGDLSGHSGIEIRVRGDGRSYQLRLRPSSRYDGVAYRVVFATRADQWVTVVIPFQDFQPTFRGRILRDVPPLDTAGIAQLGFMLADKTPGPFALEIKFVRTWEGS